MIIFLGCVFASTEESHDHVLTLAQNVKMLLIYRKGENPFTLNQKCVKLKIKWLSFLVDLFFEGSRMKALFFKRHM